MTQRKSISTGTRFNIFKRDFFTCAYCGGKPPKVVLEVDHIHPVCAGGDSSKDNLITACFECNRGKGAKSLSVVPESLEDKALRVKEAEKQLRAYRKEITKQQQRIESDAWDVIHELYGDECNSISKKIFRSVKVFLERLDKPEVIEAAEIAGSRFEDYKCFKYFCGICWNKIKQGDDDAQG